MDALIISGSDREVNNMKQTLLIILALFIAVSTASAEGNWYTEGNFSPAKRIEITLVNSLDFDRTDCPIVITREEMPIKDLHEMWVTIVDPSLPSKPAPSKEELAFVGGHGLREETNGHQLFYQLDDLDKDGVWDELFFQTDIKANGKKTLYIYIGFSQRGWNEHGTHATIGSYCRHIIPWWESGHIGWKLWYPTSVDMYGKRKSVLMAFEMCLNNYCGYQGVPAINNDYGSDIMRVADSFGAGGIGLFDTAANTDSLSRPRYTPQDGMKMSPASWNEGQISDTRYAFEVVVNGPCRSMIKVKTMNWNTGNGAYEAEQWYTSYTNQSYSTCKVVFPTFQPMEAGAAFACGIRKNLQQYREYQKGGVVVSMGKDKVSDPDGGDVERGLVVDFIGTAMIVKDVYNPDYLFVPAYSGNHTFRVPVNESKSYEYMIAGAWEGGAVYNTPDSFENYVLKTAKEYNNPVGVAFKGIDEKAAAEAK